MSRSYQSLGPEYVTAEVEKLKKIGEVVDKLWQREVSLYEQDESIKDFKEGPDALVNPNIFPYDRSLFPLLDIYHLIGESVNDYTKNSPTNVFDKKRRLPTNGEVRIAGYLPCSALALWKSLVPPYRAQNSRPRFLEALGDSSVELPSPVMAWDDIESTDFSFLEEWYYDIVSERLAWAGVTGTSSDDSIHSEERSVSSETDNSRTDSNSSDHEILPFDERTEMVEKSDSNLFGICNLPTDTGLRTKILLKLLKHSLSNLQRDHRLARAVLYSMIEFRCFDFGQDSKSGVDTLRYFLAVVHSESIRTCMAECHDPFLNDDENRDEDGSDLESVDESFNESKDEVLRPDHYCQDWQEFESMIMTIFGFGIDFITNEHANVISAFAIQQYEAIGFIELDGGDELLGCWHDDFDVEYLNLVTHIVIGVGVHAHTMRYRMKKMLQKAYSKTGGDNTPDVQAELKKLSSSYRNCMRILVDIGEQSLRRLPANEQTANLGGYIVCALVTMLSDEIPLSLNKLTPVSDYAGNQCKTKPLLINPMRYSDLITNASNQQSLRLEEVRKIVLTDCVVDSENDEIVRDVFLSPPPKDVQDVVRGLFLRQLVDTNISGCGYGDFLAWHRLSASPLDSMIYEHAMQFPEDEDQQREGGWGLDEEETESHGGKKLVARYDFTVLMLNRAWNLPWSPSSNASFQLPFRQAIKTLALCTYRYGIPSAILVGLFEFIPRQWWPDDRIECWRYECQLTELGKLIKRKRFERTTPNSTPNVQDRRKTETKTFRFVTCSGCSMARACSNKHLKRVEGHMGNCKKPPLRPFTSEDEAFCREVMGDEIAPVVSSEKGIADGSGADDEENAESDDDSASWESIGSDEESTPCDKTSKTDLIFRYFDTNSYKLQKFEEPAFATAIDGAYY